MLWPALALLACIAIKVWLDPWLNPESPTDRERREWTRDRARMMSGRDT